MTVITSNGTGGGNWSATVSWTGATVPIEGDTVIIQNGDTITIDQDITVGADTTTAAIDVASGGKLEVLHTVAADYILTCKGDLKTSSGGTIEFGTVVNPIPAARTFTVKLNYSASLVAGKYGLINNGTMILQGASKTSHTLLTSDLSATGTVWTVVSTTGWEAGDKVAITSTNRTYTQHELEVIQTVDSGTQITCVAGVTYAHLGTSPKQAEIINLNRNIKVAAYNATYNSYVYLPNGGTTDCDFAEFSELGINSNTKYGIDIRATGTGNCNINNCSIWNIYRLYLYNCTYINLSNCAVYNITRLYAYHDDHSVLNNSVFIAQTDSSLFNSSTELTITNITLSSNASYGVWFSGCTILSFNGCTTHSNNSYGIYIHSNSRYDTYDNIDCWCNNGGGLYLNYGHCVLDNFMSFGNEYSNIYIVNCTACLLKNIQLDGDSYTTYGIEFDLNYGIITIEDGIIGQTTPHGSADVMVYTGSYITCVLINCILASTVEVEGFGGTLIESYLQCEDHDQVQYADKAWYRNGIVVRDGTTYKYGSYSTRFDYQYNNSEWLEYETYIPVKDGEQIVASAWLRKNASYTDSNRPKLTISGQGITEDNSQMSDVTDTWERVTVLGTPTRTGLAKLTISTYLVNAGASAWVDFKKTDILSGVLNTIEGDYWANGHIAKVFMDTGSITAVEFWSTLTADVNGTSSFGALMKDYIDAKLSDIKAKTDTIDWADITSLIDEIGGKWEITSNQMIFYKSDNITEVMRFNLFDADGNPAVDNVYKRERV